MNYLNQNSVRVLIVFVCLSLSSLCQALGTRASLYKQIEFPVAVVNKMLSDANFTITAITRYSQGAVTYSSSSTSVATVNANTGEITLTGTGTTTITATQAPWNGFPRVQATYTLNVSVIALQLSWSDMSKTFGDPDFNLTAPTSNNNAGGFTYSLAPNASSNVVSINGNTVRILNAGTTTIRATQAASNGYTAAYVDAQLVVSPATANLSFADITKTYGDADFNLNATSSSSGSITYTLAQGADTNVVSISGNTVHILNAGITQITATQAATANSNAPTLVTINLVVNKKDPSINFPQQTVYYSGGLQNTQTYAWTVSSNSPGNFTFSSSDNSRVNFAGNLANGTSYINYKGTVTVTVDQAATTNYNAGTRSITVNITCFSTCPV